MTPFSHWLEKKGMGSKKAEPSLLVLSFFLAVAIISNGRHLFVQFPTGVDIFLSEFHESFRSVFIAQGQHAVTSFRIRDILEWKDLWNLA